MYIHSSLMHQAFKPTYSSQAKIIFHYNIPAVLVWIEKNYIMIQIVLLLLCTDRLNIEVHADDDLS